MRLLVVVMAVAVAGGAGAQTLRVQNDAEAMQKLEQRRTENHRRDCEAQWLGQEKRLTATAVSRDAFVEECIRATANRCHPRGSDSRCDYRRDRDRAAH